MQKKSSRSSQLSDINDEDGSIIEHSVCKINVHCNFSENLEREIMEIQPGDKFAARMLL